MTFQAFPGISKHFQATQAREAEAQGFAHVVVVRHLTNQNPFRAYHKFEQEVQIKRKMNKDHMCQIHANSNKFHEMPAINHDSVLSSAHQGAVFVPTTHKQINESKSTDATDSLWCFWTAHQT